MKSVKGFTSSGGLRNGVGGRLAKSRFPLRFVAFRKNRKRARGRSPFWWSGGGARRFGIVRARGDDRRRQAGGGGRTRTGREGRRGGARAHRPHARPGHDP